MTLEARGLLSRSLRAIRVLLDPRMLKCCKQETLSPLLPTGFSGVFFLYIPSPSSQHFIWFFCKASPRVTIHPRSDPLVRVDYMSIAHWEKL